VTDGTNQQALGQGRGWWRGYNGSEFGVWAKWSIGLATSMNPQQYRVPWGQVMATTSFKAYSTMIFLAQGVWAP